MHKQLPDISDATVGPDGRLYLLSDQGCAPARLPDRWTRGARSNRRGMADRRKSAEPRGTGHPARRHRARRAGHQGAQAQSATPRAAAAGLTACRSTVRSRHSARPPRASRHHRGLQRTVQQFDSAALRAGGTGPVSAWGRRRCRRRRRGWCRCRCRRRCRLPRRCGVRGVDRRRRVASCDARFGFSVTREASWSGPGSWSSRRPSRWSAP